jgi:hypothetical protein
MSRLDGSVNAQVQLSITFDGAAQFYLHFKGATNCAADGIRSVEKHRFVDAASEGIHHGTQGGHPGASGRVARGLSDIAAQPAQLLANRLQLCGGRLRMAGKASELFYATRYTPPTISRDGVAKRSTGSEQLATWFSGYSCGVRPIGACMVAAPVREKVV